MNNIYCFYLDNYDRLSEFLVTYESLKATNPQYPIGCLLGRTIVDTNDSKLCDFLQSLGILPLTSNKQLCEISYTGNNIDDVWWGCGRLELYRFQQFSKIVSLDTDLLIRENIDELFNYPDGSMAYHSDTVTDPNGGIIVIEPNTRMEQAFLKEREDGYANHKFKFHYDQSFISYYTDYTNKPELHLPLTYNFVVKEMETISSIKVSDAKVLHFGCFTRKVENLTEDFIIRMCWGNMNMISEINNYLNYYDEIINKYKKEQPQLPLCNSVVYTNRMKKKLGGTL